LLFLASPCTILQTMQKQFAVLEVRKIKDQGTLNRAMQHNTRLIKQDHCDQKREYLNHYSRNLDDVMALYQEKLPAKVRSNAVHVVEFVVSASEDKLSKIDYIAYFKAATTWLSDKLGGQKNRLGYFIHEDEDNPHLHVLVMPLHEGKLTYNRYLGGNKYQLRTLQSDFANEVGQPFGLERGIMNAGSKKRSFHTYNSLVHAPIPKLPIMELPQISFLFLRDPKEYAKETLEKYIETIQPMVTLLTQKARLAEFQEEEIQKLKRENSARAEIIAQKNRTIAAFQNMILEGGSKLEQYRIQIKEVLEGQRASPKPSRDKPPTSFER